MKTKANEIKENKIMKSTQLLSKPINNHRWMMLDQLQTTTSKISMAAKLFLTVSETSLSNHQIVKKQMSKKGFNLKQTHFQANALSWTDGWTIKMMQKCYFHLDKSKTFKIAANLTHIEMNNSMCLIKSLCSLSRWNNRLKMTIILYPILRLLKSNNKILLN